jgi:hypothetical protein
MGAVEVPKVLSISVVKDHVFEAHIRGPVERTQTYESVHTRYGSLSTTIYDVVFETFTKCSAAYIR